MVFCENDALEAAFDVVLIGTDEVRLLDDIFELVVP